MDLFIGLSADFAIIIAKEGRNEKCSISIRLPVTRIARVVEENGRER